MKILVTGAAGFIGYHTARALLERGDTVVGLDNLNAYYDPALKEARLAQLRAVEKRYRPLQPGDVPETHSDISDLARDTGYRPQVSAKGACRASGTVSVALSAIKEAPWAYRPSEA